MRLRIDVDRRASGDVVTLHGELLAAGIGELERVSDGLEMPLTLDLSHLQTADEAGVAALHAARGRGVRLVGMSPYIALLLEGAGTAVRTYETQGAVTGRDVGERAPGRRRRR
jgi:anti-anti-sigma regulatory factor